MAMTRKAPAGPRRACSFWPVGTESLKASRRDPSPSRPMAIVDASAMIAYISQAGPQALTLRVFSRDRRGLALAPVEPFNGPAGGAWPKFCWR